jgi:hypothetical protein
MIPVLSIMPNFKVEEVVVVDILQTEIRDLVVVVVVDLVIWHFLQYHLFLGRIL